MKWHYQAFACGARYGGCPINKEIKSSSKSEQAFAGGGSDGDINCTTCRETSIGHVNLTFNYFSIFNQNLY